MGDIDAHGRAIDAELSMSDIILCWLLPDSTADDLDSFFKRASQSAVITNKDGEKLTISLLANSIASTPLDATLKSSVRQGDDDEAVDAGSASMTGRKEITEVMDQWNEVLKKYWSLPRGDQEQFREELLKRLEDSLPQFRSANETDTAQLQTRNEDKEVLAAAVNHLLPFDSNHHRSNSLQPRELGKRELAGIMAAEIIVPFLFADIGVWWAVGWVKKRKERQRTLEAGTPGQDVTAGGGADDVLQHGNPLSNIPQYPAISSTGGADRENSDNLANGDEPRDKTSGGPEQRVREFV
ncbi:hypothetical protein QFC19_000448 [Naganishia cerealis]|uniref:Uncharacterized protein n=1 Tax=Naganishia cerealis TaxID=610337 RepID=A0ACC2WN95_9TREE|nr:hypothetical protein QFC19_000448 [Naganishia cerealis]